MKRLTVLTLFLFLIIVIILPAFIARGCDFRTPASFPGNLASDSVKEKKQAPKALPEKDIIIKVYRSDLKQIVEMNLEDYVKGVVSAEMPVSFELSALKAQAIAARTYVLKRIEDGKGSVSTDFNLAQDWASKERLKEKWGEGNYLAYWQKISQAVEETGGLVLTYQGKLINAYYHSTCGGKTESGEEVFKHSLPYLKSVSCSWDTRSPRYQEQKEFDVAQLKQLLGVPQNKQLNLKVLATTKGKRIKTINVGNKAMEAIDFRKILGLRSTRFSWMVKGKKIYFTTIGNGHGVGLCQYGADGLAKQGKSCQEILEYYYSGVKIRDYTTKNNL